MRHDNSSKMVKIAIKLGCKTVSDLAKFIKEYNSEILVARV